MKSFYTVLCADGKSTRQVEASKVQLSILPDHEFIIYRERGNSYWIVGEISSGARVSLPKGLQKQAIQSAEERIAFVGIENVKKMIAERAESFKAILSEQSR